MVATNDDIVNAINELKSKLTPIEKIDNTPPSRTVYHNGVEVEYNELNGKWYPKK